MTRQPPPRRRTDFSHITVCDAVRTRLAQLYAQLGTWKAVGAELGVPAGTCQRVATTGYEPKRPAIRAALGLPVLLPAPACQKCGIVHARQCRVVPAWVSAAAQWLASVERLEASEQRVYGRCGKVVA